jgi:GDP-4-dehydro-6-deoxy-D-mannose reductase
VRRVRAVVTGGNGFVGTWLSEHLRACGDEVLSVDREVEVTDAVAVRDTVTAAAPEVLYHLAALTHVGRSWEGPGEVFAVNALGTLNVLEAARACSLPPRVLIVSSAEVYGSVTEDELPIDEDVPLAPVTPYGASKVAAEFLGIQAHLGYGLPVVRVRPFNHVGPGQAAGFVVASLASRIVEARRSGTRAVPVGNLGARRDLTDVRDVVRAYRLLMEHGVPGEVYNVCSGHDVSIEEVACQLLELAGVDLQLEVDPALARPVDVPVLRGDCAKLHDVTGWQPEIDFTTTLRDVLEHWGRNIS